MRQRLVAGLGVIAALLLAGGCVTPPHQADFPAPPEPIVALQPGDVLDLQFVYWPDLSDSQTIRPDGKVALKLVGDVKVQDLAPDQVRVKLNELYADKIKNPEINVVVKSYDSQRVYVGGEVRQPGVMALRGQMTALDALMMAGGPIKQSAKLKKVVVVRRINGQQVAQSINLKRALQKPDSEPFYLAPCDIIFVPRVTIDRLDQWVDQYINQLIPRSTTMNMTFFKDIDPATSNVTNYAGQGL